MSELSTTTGADMDHEWTDWRHGVDTRLGHVERQLGDMQHQMKGIRHELDGVHRELRLIRWLLGILGATQVAIIGFLLVMAQMLLSLR